MAERALKKRRKGNASRKAGDVAKAPRAPRAPQTSPNTIRAMVIASGAAAIIGIALVGTHESVTGAFLVVGGMLSLVGSIHKLGRLGVDTPTRAGQSQRDAA